MHPPGIDDLEAGPPPLRRAATGIVLGLVTGALAALVLPREPRGRPAADDPAGALPPR